MYSSDFPVNLPTAPSQAKATTSTHAAYRLAIAVIDQQQRIQQFNQVFASLWDLPNAWLKPGTALTELFDCLTRDQYWKETHCQAVWAGYQQCNQGDQNLQLTQTNGVSLDLYFSQLQDGCVMLTVQDLTNKYQIQQRLSEEVKRLTFLLGLTERLQTSDNILEIGQFALRYLIAAMGAAFGDIKVINGSGDQRSAGVLTNEISGEFIATYGAPAVNSLMQTLSKGIPYGQGLLWDVVESGQPLFVEDYAHHPKAVKAFQHPAIGQLGIFPVPSANGTIIGVLTLESRSLQKLQEAPQQDMLLAACRILGAAIERVQSQNRLHQINQDLERASRLKSEFLASMSHELRTPLNSILGFSELLLRNRDQVSDRQIKHLNAIRQSGEHLLQLINDILDLSKVEAGKVELDIQTVSMQTLCRQCLDMVRVRATRKRLVLSLEVDYRIDQVYLDERRTRQMIVNLLSNAVKFTPERGQIKLSLRLAYGHQLLQETRPDHSPVNVSTPYMCIEVSDTGIGISAKKSHLLFRPFQQIDASLTRQHEGTGLGLALTKRLAELHGGTVSYETVEGKGSSFRVWLPIHEFRNLFADENTPETEINRHPLFEDNESQYPTQVRILVVEDQPYNQALISELLESEGFQVELINDGAVMEQTIHSELASPNVLPDLVLMDIQLPGVDGFQLMRLMKSHPQWSQVPVIAVTAMAMAGDRERCLDAGADDYLSKPLDFQMVLTSVRELLELALSND